MLVFWEQRLVFLATPKTASTAIEVAIEALASFAVLRPKELKHTPALRYRRFLQPFLERQAGEPFTVVALMREPVDWLGSWYRYRQRDDIADPAKSTAGLTFEDFVEGWLSDPRPPFADVGSQARFLAGPEGLGVDRLFRYEALDRFIDFLEDRLRCEIVLPKINVSPPGALDLSEGLRARLAVQAAEDFRLYEGLAGG
jgi:hypothetical protein